MPSLRVTSRTWPRTVSVVVAIRSARKCRGAPARACSASGTSLVASTNAAASLMTLVSGELPPAHSRSASGSRPRSRAIIARVRQLRLEREIEILELLLRLRRINASGERRLELALLFDALENRDAAFGKFAKILRAIADVVAELDFVETARCFFAVARDEGKRVAFVEQRGRPELAAVRVRKLAGNRGNEVLRHQSGVLVGRGRE